MLSVVNNRNTIKLNWSVFENWNHGFPYIVMTLCGFSDNFRIEIIKPRSDMCAILDFDQECFFKLTAHEHRQIICFRVEHERGIFASFRDQDISAINYLLEVRKKGKEGGDWKLLNAWYKQQKLLILISVLFCCVVNYEHPQSWVKSYQS